MNNLQNVLQHHLLAAYFPINAIPSTCCLTSTFPVIDFDEVKRVFCRIHGIDNEIKSVDCLHIGPVKRILCFIEMKNGSNFINRILNLYPGEDQDSYKTRFDIWLLDLAEDLRAKVADSLLLVIAALGIYSSNTNDIATLFDRNDVQLKYLVLTHLSSRDYLLLNISTLTSNSGKKGAIKFGPLAGKQAEAFVTTADDFDTYVAKEL